MTRISARQHTGCGVGLREAYHPAWLLLLLLLAASTSSAQNVGTCYGLYNYNLSAATALSLLRNNSFSLIKTYWSNSAWLDTVQTVYTNTSVGVTIAISNGDLAKAATNQNNFITTLINTTRAHRDIVKYIAIGNEPFATWNRAEAMPNLLAAHNRVVQALQDSGLDGAVKVLIPWSAEVVINTYPVASSVFDPAILGTMQTVLQYVSSSASAFSINLYPYFSYDVNYPGIPLDFALGNNGSSVTGSQLVSMIEGARVALGKIGYGNVPIIVGETGWPSAGARFATLANMQAYLSHVRDAAVATGVDIYVFAAFDEPNKPQGAADAAEYSYGFFTSAGVAEFEFNFQASDDSSSDKKKVAILAGVLSAVGVLLLAAAVAAFIVIRRRASLRAKVTDAPNPGAKAQGPPPTK